MVMLKLSGDGGMTKILFLTKCTLVTGTTVEFRLSKNQFGLLFLFSNALDIITLLKYRVLKKPLRFRIHVPIR